jgi:F-type H+-transporting ATPase subunit delta
MSRHPVGRAYGRALYEVARDAGVLATVLQEIDAVEQALGTDLAPFLASPKAQLTARLAVLDEVFAGADERLLALLKLAVRKGRAAFLPQMLAEVRILDDAASGRARGRLETAVALPPALQAELEAALSRRLGLELHLERRQDPELLGGFTARVGDRLVDASLRSRLERLRRLLRAS